MKRIGIMLVVLVLTFGLAGCAQEEALPQKGVEETSASEFTGKYSGDEGSFTFEPGGTVLIEFTGEGEFVKYLDEYPNNTSYTYVFKDGQEVVPPEEASIFYIYENEGDELAITYFSYDLYDDKMVIFPNSDFEQTFYKE